MSHLPEIFRTTNGEKCAPLRRLSGAHFSYLTVDSCFGGKRGIKVVYRISVWLFVPRNFFQTKMAQPSVANYFNTRKRSAADDKATRAKKVLVLDSEDARDSKVRLLDDRAVVFSPSNKLTPKPESTPSARASGMAKKPSRRMVQKRPTSQCSGQRDIQEVFKGMSKNTSESAPVLKQTEVVLHSPESLVNSRHVTPPSSPTKSVNLMDRVKNADKEPTLKEIRQKLSRSNRLAELRASIASYKCSQKKLEEAEKRTARIEDSPTLKSFKTLEFEVNVRYLHFSFL